MVILPSSTLLQFQLHLKLELSSNLTCALAQLTPSLFPYLSNIYLRFLHEDSAEKYFTCGENPAGKSSETTALLVPSEDAAFKPLVNLLKVCEEKNFHFLSKFLFQSRTRRSRMESPQLASLRCCQQPIQRGKNVPSVPR